MISKPSKQIVPLGVGLSWQAGGLIQQKLDGKFATVKAADVIMVCRHFRELVKPNARRPWFMITPGKLRPNFFNRL